MTSRPTNRRGYPRQAAGPVRRGFTLLELLIVITIISILTTMIAVASVTFIGQARAAATRTTIRKVDEAILERVSAINRWHQRPITRLRHDWVIRGWENEWRQALSPFAGTSGFNEAELVLSRKGVLREMLPVYQPVRPAVGDSSNDAAIEQGELVRAFWFWAQYDTDNDGVLNTSEKSDMFDKITDWDLDSSNGLQSLDRPGEVFFYALLNAPVFGGQRVLEDDFKQSELKDFDPDPTTGTADGFLELVDGWGNELRFYRWPTRLVNGGYAITDDWANPSKAAMFPNPARQALMPNAPTIDLRTDPDDRSGYFAMDAFTQGIFQMYFHDIYTWHVPLVVSAGADGQLGLYEPGDLMNNGPRAAVDPTQVEATYDNITNHNSNGGL